MAHDVPTRRYSERRVTRRFLMCPKLSCEFDLRDAVQYRLSERSLAGLSTGKLVSKFKRESPLYEDSIMTRFNRESKF